MAAKDADTTTEQPQVVMVDQAAIKPAYRFVKGVSGNPSGRPRGNSEVRAAAREHTSQALAVLIAALDATKLYGKEAIEAADWGSRIAAATAILDRGWGRPTQAVRVTQEDQALLEAMPDEELMAIATGKSN